MRPVISPVEINISHDPEDNGGSIRYTRLLDGQVICADIGSMTLDDWAQAIDSNNELKGWNTERSESEWAALAHSEISEAYEEYRNGKEMFYIGDLDTGKPEGIAVEYADCMIRILHWFTQHKISPSSVLALKMEYNTRRPFRHGGKVT